MTTAETQSGPSKEVLKEIASLRESISKYKRDGNPGMTAGVYLHLAKEMADADMKDELGKAVAEMEPLVKAYIEETDTVGNRFGSASSRDKFSDILFKVGRTEEAKAMKLLAAKDYYLYAHAIQYGGSDGFTLKDAARCYREADVPGESEAGNEMCANEAADVFLDGAAREESKEGSSCRWYNMVLMHIESAIDALVEGNQMDRAGTVAADFVDRFFERYVYHIRKKNWYGAEDDLKQIERVGKQVERRALVEMAKTEMAKLEETRITQERIDKKYGILRRAEGRVHDTALDVFQRITSGGQGNAEIR
jgi:hypothetical protein